jgi:hypothetical protein
MNMNTNTTQMELGLERKRPQCRVSTRRRPPARWWFDQMHAAVDRAFDWSRTAQARPEQIYISFGGRSRHAHGSVR